MLRELVRQAQLASMIVKRDQRVGSEPRVGTRSARPRSPPATASDEGAAGAAIAPARDLDDAVTSDQNAIGDLDAGAEDEPA